MPAYRIFLTDTHFQDINAEAHEELPAKDGLPARLHFIGKEGQVVASFNPERIHGFTQREAIATARRG